METEINKAVSAAIEGDGSSTVVAKRDMVDGRMVVDGEARVLGRFQGEIECTGQLLIGQEAEVQARMIGQNITIAGRVRGDILARGRLTITATGRLEGDAVVGALIVQEGGVHHGMTKVYPEGVPEEREERMPDLLPQPPEQQLESLEPAPPLEDENKSDEAASGLSVDRVKRLWGEFF